MSFFVSIPKIMLQSCPWTHSLVFCFAQETLNMSSFLWISHTYILQL